MDRINRTRLAHLRQCRQASTRAAATLLKKLPSNTAFGTWEEWSSWGGVLAMVDTPTYSTSSFAAESDFDPDRMARRYGVRYALDLDKKQKIPATSKHVGIYVNVQDRSARYEKTTWTIGRAGYGPVQKGTFSPTVEEFWVKVPVKDLWPGELQLITNKLDKEGFYDATGRSQKSTAAQWKKLLKLTFFQTQDLDHTLANTAYDAVRDALGSGSHDERAEERAWMGIRGAYRMTNKRNRLIWVARR